MSSILNDIKKRFTPEEYDAFDEDFVMHINTVLRILNQLGCGSKDFVVTDESQQWSDFVDASESELSDIKTYIYLKVRMIFDPPSSSFILNSIKELLSELEFRIGASCETPLEE